MHFLIMTYCLAGKPCADETLATFPQWDVGRSICELALPGVAQGIRGKVQPGTDVMFECRPADPPATSLAPRGSVEMLNGEDKSAGEIFLDLIRPKR
jgi:hypothetical protein